MLGDLHNIAWVSEKGGEGSMCVCSVCPSARPDCGRAWAFGSADGGGHVRGSLKQECASVV